MATWRCDTANMHSTWTWETGHVYASGDKVVCTWYGPNYTTARSRLFECTSGGTSGGSEPTWNTTVGGTTADNTVTWTCRDPTAGSWSYATVLRYAWEKAAAGDTIYVDDSHDEQWASINFDVRYNDNTARNNPIKVLCVDKADDSLSSGAKFGTSNAGANNLGLNDSFYSYGMHFTAGGGISLGAVGYTYGNICIEGTGPGSTVLELGTNSGSSYNYIGGGNYYPVHITVKNGDIKLNRFYNYINPGSAQFYWYNGVLVAPNESYYLFSGYEEGISVEDVDLSAACTSSTTCVLIQAGSSLRQSWKFKRCKLPSGAGFSLVNRSSYDISEGYLYSSITMEQCSSGSNVTVITDMNRYGTTTTEYTLKKTDGASDGTTGYSLKMVSTASAVEGMPTFAQSSPIIAGILDSAASQTVTVDCLIDSATNLQNNEIWMEIAFPKNSGDVLGSRYSNIYTILDTPADHSSSAATWTTTGMSNPNEFKLTITFDPGQTGPYEIRVFLGKPSTTVYVDPKPAFA